MIGLTRKERTWLHWKIIQLSMMEQAFDHKYFGTAMMGSRGSRGDSSTDVRSDDGDPSGHPHSAHE